MEKFIGYRCSLCAKEYLPGQVTYTCACGGNLDVALDLESIRKKYQPDDLFTRAAASLWRYLPLLPVSLPPGAEHTPLSLAGGTPVVRLTRLGEAAGLKYL